MTKELLKLGTIVMTKGVADLIDTREEVMELIRKHMMGNYGIIDNEDIEANKYALENNERVFSHFKICNKSVYIITEWDRSYTTVMLSEEY